MLTLVRAVTISSPPPSLPSTADALRADSAEPFLPAAPLEAPPRRPFFAAGFDFRTDEPPPPPPLAERCPDAPARGADRGRRAAAAVAAAAAAVEDDDVDMRAESGGREDFVEVEASRSKSFFAGDPRVLDLRERFADGI